MSALARVFLANIAAVSASTLGVPVMLQRDISEAMVTSGFNVVRFFSQGFSRKRSYFEARLLLTSSVHLSSSCLGWKQIGIDDGRAVLCRRRGESTDPSPVYCSADRSSEGDGQELPVHLSEIPELVPLHESHFATCGNRPEVFCVLGNVDPSGDVRRQPPAGLCRGEMG